MRYPVKLEPEKGIYLVAFPDIPEAITQGGSRDEALKMALDALITAFEFYFEDSEKVPAPSAVIEDYVEVPASVAAKVLMLNSFIDSGMTQSQLASEMGVKKQEVTRLFDLQHSTKIDTIQKALLALGKQLELTAA